MLKTTTLVILAAFAAKITRTANILMIFPTPSYSHQSVYQPIWKELSLRGHRVTVMTTDPLADPTLTNLTEISWKSSYAEWTKLIRKFSSPTSSFDFMHEYQKTLVKNMDAQLSHPEVSNMIADQRLKFDLVVVEWLLTPMGAFAQRFRCPLMGLNSLGALVTGYDALGNPSHPAYVTDFGLPYSGDMTLGQRAISALYAMWARWNHRYRFAPMAEQVLRKHFGDGTVAAASLEEVEKSVSVLLVNVNRVFYTVRPNVPAVKELGGIGIHIKPSEPLPKDLQTYLDGSKNGVIYFSLGTNIQSSVLTSEKLQTIKDVLRELPYDILWKWEKDDLPNKPDNVRIAKWLPQQDILAHPNIKLFITQGGLQSLEEALYNKVPCVGMPFFAEQRHNLHGAVKYGFAKIVDFTTLNKDTLKETIMEVLTNPEYKKNAQETFDLVNDEPMKPVETAVWWIEYVIRHKGAKHLRSPTINMPWIQYLLVDVAAVLLGALLLALLLLYVAVKLIVKGFKALARKLVKGKHKTN